MGRLLQLKTRESKSCSQESCPQEATPKGAEAVESVCLTTLVGVYNCFYLQH